MHIEADSVIRCLELDTYISINPGGSVVKMLFCFQFSTGSSFWLHSMFLLKPAGNQKFSYMTSYLWHSSVARSFAETKPSRRKSKIELAVQFSHNKGRLDDTFFFVFLLLKEERQSFLSCYRDLDTGVQARRDEVQGFVLWGWSLPRPCCWGLKTHLISALADLRHSCNHEIPHVSTWARKIISLC